MSAEAVPGPACYGRGGTEPTVTDANLVLGRLGGDTRLGGELTLDAEAATQAIVTRIAEPLGHRRDRQRPPASCASRMPTWRAASASSRSSVATTRAA